jgi:hypothetical protein
MWAAVAGDSIGDNDTIFNLLIVADSIYNPSTAKVVQSFEVADANDQIDFERLTWVKIDETKMEKVSVSELQMMQLLLQMEISVCSSILKVLYLL